MLPRDAPGPGLAGLAVRHTGAVRITVWVRPGSARPGVGGERDGALIVQVSKRAVDGQATEAALAAVADALGLPRRAVTLVAGATSRTKILEVEGADPALLQRLLTWLGDVPQPPHHDAVARQRASRDQPRVSPGPRTSSPRTGRPG
ncbi:MAG: DUF167 domain-containing protein [Streptosporangiaceae bacterium]